MTSASIRSEILEVTSALASATGMREAYITLQDITPDELHAAFSDAAVRRSISIRRTPATVLAMDKAVLVVGSATYYAFGAVRIATPAERSALPSTETHMEIAA